MRASVGERGFARAEAVERVVEAKEAYFVVHENEDFCPIGELMDPRKALDA